MSVGVSRALSRVGSGFETETETETTGIGRSCCLWRGRKSLLSGVKGPSIDASQTVRPPSPVTVPSTGRGGC